MLFSEPQSETQLPVVNVRLMNHSAARKSCVSSKQPLDVSQHIVIPAKLDVQKDCSRGECKVLAGSVYFPRLVPGRTGAFEVLAPVLLSQLSKLQVGPRLFRHICNVGGTGAGLYGS